MAIEADLGGLVLPQKSNINRDPHARVPNGPRVRNRANNGHLRRHVLRGPRSRRMPVTRSTP